MNIQKPLCPSILSGFPAQPEWFNWEQLGTGNVEGEWFKL
jgi:hypothetical protein